MTSIIENDTVGAVLVCGAGVAGLQASLDLAAGGFKVYLLDSQPAIGGRMVALDRELPDGDCAMCVLSPKLVECARNRNIEILTLADVQEVSGHAGRFKVRIRQNPRYVDIRKCEGCGNCAAVCPVRLPEESDAGQSARKAIYRTSAQAIPNVFAISKAEGRPPCTIACPAGVNIQGTLALFAAGKYAEAYDLLRRRCPIPASCGRVCPHPCESACNREAMDGAVSFAGIERFIGDYIQANPHLHPPIASLHPPAEGAVAIIGSGAAGLTAAADLARMGYAVTLFEARERLGGMLRYGTPDFRLPKDILDREIQSIIDLGVEVQTNAAIARPKDLLKSADSPAGAFDAVFVATGAWVDRRLNIPGEDAAGVLGALDFIRAVNAGPTPRIGPKVLVIGSTDMAIDAARCARRLQGVESVRLACMEGGAEMQAQSDLAEQALEEGVLFHNGLDVTRIETTDGRVVSVSFRACTSVYDVYRGYKRFNPLFDDSQISNLQADTVIVAVGREAEARGFGLELRPGGRILADTSTLAASIKGIFAGGEVVLGAASIADSMAQGHKAAASMDAFIRAAANIRSAGFIPTAPHSAVVENPPKSAPNPNPEAEGKAPVSMPRRDIPERCADTREVVLGYTLEQALHEAGRCLACGLCSECMQCVQACSAGALLHDQQPTEREIEVGGILLTEDMEEAAALAGIGDGLYRTGEAAKVRSIPNSIIQGGAAAARVMEPLTSVRGTMIQRHEYPWERDVADEAPRIGVFVCQCGRNISSVVDVDQVVRLAGKQPNVQYAEACLYTCSEGNQRHVREMIRKYRLNRLVVASCSSRTHEVLFQETLRESGLNQFLFAMTDIRDQCSWVHQDDPAAATAKALDLVFMAIARARKLKQLPLYELPVTPAALILGGGVAGMTAALNLAGQGFKVHLAEKGPRLGGWWADPHPWPEKDEAQAYVRSLIAKVQSAAGIRLYLNANLMRTSGQVGAFTSVLSVAGNDTIVEHGVVLVATGNSRAGDNAALARVLRSTVTDEGYFLEAHSKLRPVDLSNEGEFVCGQALGPCSVEDAIAQALAAGARAAAVLSRPQLEIMGQIAFVNPAGCVACATCVKVCPYGAPAINALRKAEIQPAKCMGCGSCVASCPGRAIILQHQENEAMGAMFDELLVHGGSL